MKCVGDVVFRNRRRSPGKRRPTCSRERTTSSSRPQHAGRLSAEGVRVRHVVEHLPPVDEVEDATPGTGSASPRACSTPRAVPASERARPRIAWAPTIRLGSGSSASTLQPSRASAHATIPRPLPTSRARPRPTGEERARRRPFRARKEPGRGAFEGVVEVALAREAFVPGLAAEPEERVLPGPRRTRAPSSGLETVVGASRARGAGASGFKVSIARLTPRSPGSAAPRRILTGTWQRSRSFRTLVGKALASRRGMEGR